MAIYTCKCCGVPLTVEDGQQVVECDFCKTKFTVEELASNDSPEAQDSALSAAVEDEPKTEENKEETKADSKEDSKEDSEETAEQDSSKQKRLPRLSSGKKRLVSVLLVLVLLMGIVCGFQVCSSPPPALEEIYDRVVELVESSHRFNVLQYGKGLPTYAEDSEYAEINHLYFRDVPNGYLVVSDYTMFSSIDQIKAEAEQIYSKKFLDSVMYPALFDGYASENGDLALGRFYEANKWIYMRASADPNNPDNKIIYDYLKDRGMRIYDYSTMEIVDPSNSERVVIKMNSWLSSTPQDVEPSELTLVLQNGKWFLESATI